MTIEPFNEFNIEVSLSKNFETILSFSKMTELLVKDFQHLSPTEVGTFNISYLGINTLFGKILDTLYHQFEQNRAIFSHRLENQPGAGSHRMILPIQRGLEEKSKCNPSRVLATYTGIDPTKAGLNIFECT